MGSFGIWVIGYLIFLGGVAWGMVALGVPQQWVIIATVILLGLGIITGVSRTRRRDPT
jgi:hypothetical protein